jgi:[ribosomal protein S18]-alanine N-acetyltransferase
MREGCQNVVICRLSRSSVGDIAAIQAESDSPAWSAKLFSDEFSHQFSRIFGARTQGKLIGFLLLHTVMDEAHIVKFGVSSAYRGRGIGRELLREVLLQLHQGGVRWVTLEVRKSNIIAQRLYESLGFVQTSIRSRYYSDNLEDALLMNLSMVDFMALESEGLAGSVELRRSAVGAR